jgi:hypothetical protein
MRPGNSLKPAWRSLELIEGVNMKRNRFFRILAGLMILLLACVTSMIVLSTFLRDNPDPDFWLVALPPIPSYAKELYYSGGGSLGGSRMIRFETDKSAAEIQEFYWTELPKRGWVYLCSPTQLEETDCPLGLSPSVDLADVYQRDDQPGKYRAINVEIYKPWQILTDIDKRLIQIIEYSYPLPRP